jgi:hypothetical protein
VASFTRLGDNLSQWRGYAHRGPAFAIGFDPVALLAKATVAGFTLEKVIYGRKVVRDQIRQCIRDFEDTYSPADRKLHGALLATNVALLLFARASVNKDIGFKDEQEWRLVRRSEGGGLAGPRLKRRFRESGTLVVPYVEIPIHGTAGNKGIKTPVRQICVGPSPHPNELKHSVELMVEEHDLTGIGVNLSKIPLRNW